MIFCFRGCSQQQNQGLFYVFMYIHITVFFVFSGLSQKKRFTEWLTMRFFSFFESLIFSFLPPGVRISFNFFNKTLKKAPFSALFLNFELNFDFNFQKNLSN